MGFISISADSPSRILAIVLILGKSWLEEITLSYFSRTERLLTPGALLISSTTSQNTFKEVTEVSQFPEIGGFRLHAGAKKATMQKKGRKRHKTLKKVKKGILRQIHTSISETLDS